jgi:hypothetical protein
MLGARTVGLGEEECNHAVERRIQARDNPIFRRNSRFQLVIIARGDPGPKTHRRWWIKRSSLAHSILTSADFIGSWAAQGKYDKAIENLQQSIQLRPPTWFIRAQLISAYALTQQLNKD